MIKRSAEESLEVSVSTSSPASKKAKIESLSERKVETPASINGQTRGNYERNGDHNVAAVDQEECMLDDATSTNGDDDQQLAFTSTTRQEAPTEGYKDLYLDTVDRAVLDFDFEKLCSISLSNINVYACLVCGKYFQGRGPKSYAYFHALEVGHHVYVNMGTKRVYVLPEGYEVKSKSLEDIRFQVDPHLPKNEVLQLDREATEAGDLSGKRYRPGKKPPLASSEDAG